MTPKFRSGFIIVGDVSFGVGGVDRHRQYVEQLGLQHYATPRRLTGVNAVRAPLFRIPDTGRCGGNGRRPCEETEVHTAAIASISRRKFGLASPRRTHSVLPGG